jgi:hypothetical protein
VCVDLLISGRHERHNGMVEFAKKSSLETLVSQK